MDQDWDRKRLSSGQLNASRTVVELQISTIQKINIQELTAAWWHIGPKITVMQL